MLSLMLLGTLRLTGVVMHRTSIKQPTEQARTQILYKMKHEEITEMRRRSMIRARSLLTQRSSRVGQFQLPEI